MSHWSSLRPRASLSILDPHQDFGRYPVVALCPGDPTALDLQDRLLHVLQQFAGGVGQHNAFDLGRRCSARQLTCIRTTSMSSPALAQLGWIKLFSHRGWLFKDVFLFNEQR